MINIEKISYRGWQNCYRISNSSMELIATSDVGPRIISCQLSGKENMFYENPSEVGLTSGEKWIPFGGHRLWLAPELPKRTYYPDNDPLEVVILKTGLQLIAPIETTTGIQKTIEIQMDENEPKVIVRHKMTNMGLWPVTFAPWALSVLGPNGVAVFPHPPRNRWPDSLVPSHSITLWGYTHMSDPRYTWGDEYILFRQNPSVNDAQKIGMLNTSGWAAYVRDNTAFIKLFQYIKDGDYTDFDSNLESWTNQDFLELETLGPLQKVDLEESITLDETWFLAANIPSPNNDADVNKNLLPVVNRLLGK